jgi:hypothetical protein
MGVPSYIFGGRGEELGITMLKTDQFKRFSEILLAQVEFWVFHEILVLHLFSFYWVNN